ncbi:MAG: hypothetical protein K940chlam3_00262 [Chlamydiae bacterium]|nr:hypothetical protein [Chlamydiota bacterium]
MITPTQKEIKTDLAFDAAILCHSIDGQFDLVSHQIRNKKPHHLEMLLDQGYEFLPDGLLDANERSFTHIASEEGSLSCLKLLLVHKAYVDPIDTNEHTPLHLATWDNNCKVMKLLLDNNANVHAENTNGNTPLHIASKQGHSKAVSLLLENKAKVDKDNDHKKTALYYAAENDHLKVVKVLVQNKADINKPSCFSQGLLTPLNVAASKKIERYLLGI